MLELNQAFKLCIEHVIALQADKKQSTKPARMTQIFTPVSDFSVIDWLSAQPIYPKFYWQTRDAHEEVVALGAALEFYDPMEVYSHLNTQQRVWGGKPFNRDVQFHSNPKSQSNDVKHLKYDKNQDVDAYFFLPQIEIERIDDTWRLHINLQGDLDKLFESLSRLSQQITTLETLKKQTGTILHHPQFLQWQQLIENALQAMSQREFDKVVLARQTQVTLPKAISAEQLLKVSREKNLRSYHFMLSLSPTFSFVGSTPERLYRRINSQIETEALAGTIGRSDSLAEDAKLSQWLLKDEKNCRENQFVVDDIISRLTPVTSELNVQSEVELVRLRKVQHLRKRVKGELSQGILGAELLDVLQPTAAIAGLPRKESLAFIHQYEPFDRRWYSGSLGYMGHQDAEFCVTIRSAIIEANQVTLYAGAGIVPGSTADFEWQELDRKSSTLLSLMLENTLTETSLEEQQ